LYSQWRAAHFTAAEIAAGLAAPYADPGGYGVTNLMRYTLGLDARQPQQASGTPRFSFTPASSTQSGGMTLQAPGMLTLSFEVPQDTADVGIFLESSADLTTWTRTGSYLYPGELQNGRRQVHFNAPGPTGNLGGLQIGGASPASQLFYRIAIEPATPGVLPRY